MKIDEAWNYYILPGCIARKQEGKVEVKDSNTGIWVDLTGDIDFQRMMSQDATSASEEEAEKMYDYFKKGISKS